MIAPPRPESFTFRSGTTDPSRPVDPATLLPTTEAGHPRAASGSPAWLFVSPHDDDACIGAGLLFRAAMAAGITPHVCVVTDGRGGYCSVEDRDRIVDLRRAETVDSFERLGLSAEAQKTQVHRCEFPCSQLWSAQGRRPARPDEPARGGHYGMQNEFTGLLRQIRPEKVFLATSADYHPDHRYTHGEFLISLFHAGGSIWPELGPPIENVPDVWEYAVYCDFPEPPTVELTADAGEFEIKMDSILAYRSQKQIESTIATIRRAGPYEYFRHLGFRLYSPTNYRGRFQAV